MASSARPLALVTPRLLLRPLTEADAPAIFDYARVPEVSRHTLWEPHASVEDSLAFIRDFALPRYETGISDPWGIVLRRPEAGISEGKVVGTVGVYWNSERSRRAELAYALARPLWGRGLATEAARIVIEHAFRAMGAHRVEAPCVAENRGSARVMEKLGMRLEGTRRRALFHRGRYWDVELRAILRDEWAALGRESRPLLTERA
jgi:ribosomal-protein-alanine N-acetyltransferase